MRRLADQALGPRPVTFAWPSRTGVRLPRTGSMCKRVGYVSPPHEHAVRQTAGNTADANIMLLICTVAGLPGLDLAAAHNGGRRAGYPADFASLAADNG